MKRSRWVAGLLSVPVCGLGHLYLGAWRRGVAFFVGDLCIQVVALMAFMHVRSTPLNLIAAVSPVVGYNVWAVVDAVRSTRKSVAFRAPWLLRWLAYAGLWWGCVNWGYLYVAYGVRATMAEAFYLPTGAMSDTLIRGDRFLIDKLPRSAPRRGDVVTFRHDSDIWVKRVIGLPGERLEIRDGLVHINGQPLDEPYLRLEGCRQRDFKAVVVPPDHYFVMGDNRMSSKDSRFIGSIRAGGITGRAMVIFYSEDPGTGEVRWRRIGKVIR